MPPPGPSRSRSASPIRRRRCGWGPPSPAASSWRRLPAWRSRRARSPRRTDARPCGWSIRRARPCPCATWTSPRYDPASVVVSQGLEAGEVVVTAGVQVLRPGQKVRLLGAASMTRFNLSEWAIRHRSLVAYFMLVLVVAGVGVLPQARAERGSGLHRSRPWWCRPPGPGATVGDTLQQITDRLERKLQETPDLDYLKSYTTAGQATIFVNLKDSTPAAAGAGHLVPGAQEGGRHPPHAAAGHRRPRSSTTSSATPTASSTASPPTGSPAGS